MSILDIEEIEYCSDLSGPYYRSYGLRDTPYVLIKDMSQYEFDSYWTTRREALNIRGISPWLSSRSRGQIPGQKVFNDSPKYIQEKLIFVLDQLV
jgi:hypothetical protein